MEWNRYGDKFATVFLDVSENGEAGVTQHLGSKRPYPDKTIWTPGQTCIDDSDPFYSAILEEFNAPMV